jgi:quinol monooxygenase YgiN
MTVEWLVPLGQAQCISTALQSMMSATRATPGCLGCTVSTGLGEQGTVRYVEEWQTEQDLRRRLESDAFTRLAALIEASPRPPRLEFALPGGTRGLDLVEEIQRGCASD